MCVYNRRFKRGGGTRRGGKQTNKHTHTHTERDTDAQEEGGGADDNAFGVPRGKVAASRQTGNNKKRSEKARNINATHAHTLTHKVDYDSGIDDKRDTAQAVCNAWEYE